MNFKPMALKLSRTDRVYLIGVYQRAWEQWGEEWLGFAKEGKLTSEDVIDLAIRNIHRILDSRLLELFNALNYTQKIEIGQDAFPLKTYGWH